MPPKSKELVAKAKNPTSKASKKVTKKGATSKPQEKIVYVVVCSYSFKHDDYLDEEVKIIGTYASLHDANSKVIELWRNPEELNCGSLYRELARDGKEKDGKLLNTSQYHKSLTLIEKGSLWWYHEHCGGTSVCIEKFDLAKDGGDKLVVKQSTGENVDLVDGLGRHLEVIESSGQKAKATWSRIKTDRPKLCVQGPATYPYRLHRMDISEAEGAPESKENPKLEEPSKTLKRILGVQAVDSVWKWKVEWEGSPEAFWVDEGDVRGKDIDKLWEFLTMAMDVATPDS